MAAAVFKVLYVVVHIVLHVLYSLYFIKKKIELSCHLQRHYYAKHKSLFDLAYLVVIFPEFVHCPEQCDLSFFRLTQSLQYRVKPAQQKQQTSHNVRIDTLGNRGLWIRLKFVRNKIKFTGNGLKFTKYDFS